LSKIISIGTAVPGHCHKQEELCEFADKIYSKDETGSRKLRFLYRQSGIHQRYSVIPDFTKEERSFFPPSDDLEPFPGIDQRMEWYNSESLPLAEAAVKDCLGDKHELAGITHLITVSCTGMSAPGLDLKLMESLKLPNNINRTSVNFMGCYAAVHALKIADTYCRTDKANVLIVCVELCTLHFQKQASVDNITSTLLFSDGAAAILVSSGHEARGIKLNHFFSDVSFKGKNEMAWEISSKGFLMTLSGYVPELIREDFEDLFSRALAKASVTKEEIDHWCIHPGGKKILEAIQVSLGLSQEDLSCSYEVLKEYGNMSSVSIVFVLKKIFDQLKDRSGEKIFGAAFGPGLTMETFIATYA